MNEINIPRERIQSIDLLRGIVMIIMALDHVRDYFHYDVFFFDPENLTKTNPILFYTRFITHFCAPVFVFLAGTSAFLVSQKLGKKSLSIWLIKRGIWLIFVEFVIIKFGWLFNFNPSLIFMGVIWVLGAGMIVLAGLIHLPRMLVIPLSLLVVFGHNAMDNFQPGSWSGLWTLLHIRATVETPLTTFLVGYPLIPWVFVMALGYYFGGLYAAAFEVDKRKRWLTTIGIACIALFFVIRGINVYGDPVPWSKQVSFSFTVMSFFKVFKYPPSLLYLLVTLGPAILFLSVAERWKGSFIDKIVVIGRVPMFYYIIHIYLIHTLALLAAMLTGFSPAVMITDDFLTRLPSLQGYGFDLWVVYLVWISLVVALYPICYWYYNYKKNNRDKWWLSYL